MQTPGTARLAVGFVAYSQSSSVCGGTFQFVHRRLRHHSCDPAINPCSPRAKLTVPAGAGGVSRVDDGLICAESINICPGDCWTGRVVSAPVCQEWIGRRRKPAVMVLGVVCGTWMYDMRNRDRSTNSSPSRPTTDHLIHNCRRTPHARQLSHIETVCQKLNRLVGICYKLSHKLPDWCLHNIYIYCFCASVYFILYWGLW